MVPPSDIFGIIPTWIGVYLAVLVASGVGGYALYRRVFWLVMQGKPVARFDRPLERLTGAITIVLGQRKVLQRVGSNDPRGGGMDLAGIGHASIFWGFLSFSLSYLIFIFGGVFWSPLPETVLTETGVRVFSIYLDIFALVILLALVWALFRRWLARPHRLRFDLTRKGESVIIVGLTGGLMIATLLVHAFYVAEGGAGPEAEIFIGGALGRWFVSMGLSASASASLQTISW
ncbi:MAG: hypothetical protein ACE1ZZ_00785, partial [Dehalococcoidia bacterium]